MCLIKTNSQGEKMTMFVILDRMVTELFDGISILHNANAIRLKHNWNSQQWDRAYLDLEEDEFMNG